MRRIELDPVDWPRLEGWPLFAMLPYLDPVYTRLFVVEDEDGQIVGTCGIMSWLMAEGCDIAPEHQKRGVVFRMLLEGVLEATGGAQWIMAGSASDEMTGLLQGLQGVPVPMTPFVVPRAGIESALGLRQE